MTSNINPNVPTAGSALTSDVRENFLIASTEITNLQNAINSGTTLAPNLASIAGLNGAGLVGLISVGSATLYTITAVSQGLLAQTTAAGWRTGLGLGTAALSASTDFAPASYSPPVANLPVMVGATGGAAGTAGIVPKPAAGQQGLFLTGAATFTGLQGTVTGAIAGGYNLYSAAYFDSPRYKFFDNGNSGASKSIDVSVAAVQRITLTAATPTITFTSWAPANTAYVLVLEVIQDATGSRVPTFAGTGGTSFKYVGGNAPQWSTTAGAIDEIAIVSVDGGVTAKVFVAGLGIR